MKNKQRYISVIIIIIIISIVFLLTIGLKLINNEKVSDLIALDNNVVFKNTKGKWKVITEDTELKEYNWNSLYTFVDNVYLGKYNIYYNEELYLFDNNRNPINYNGSLIAFSNKEYKLIDFKTNSITNDKYINEVLNKNDLTNKKLTSSYYINIDIDNDDEKEQLYVVSNKFPIDIVNDNKYFSFVFLVDNEKIKMIYKKIEKTEDSYSGCKPYIKSILDVNNDNKYEVIINCAEYSTNKIHSTIYKYKNNQFENVVSS